MTKPQDDHTARVIPDDVTSADAESMWNVRRAIGGILIAIFLLAIFNSEGFTIYARDLPGNAFSDMVVAAADQWNELMTDLGLTRVAENIREAFLNLKETQW